MRISDEDSFLARELALVFDLNVRDEGALRVILSSHRQLPSDEKASGIQLPVDVRDWCDDPMPGGDGNIRCRMSPGHMGDHRTATGRHVWEQS